MSFSSLEERNEKSQTARLGKKKACPSASLNAASNIVLLVPVINRRDQNHTQLLQSLQMIDLDDYNCALRFERLNM